MSPPVTSLEQREALLLGETTAQHLASEALTRAEESAHLGAFLSLSADLALHEAERADARLARATPAERGEVPPLTGLPTAHKDLLDVRGSVTTHGSRAVPHMRAESDGPVAARIRAAGAVSIGKTQVPEFGIAGYSENDVAPPARNPRDPSLTAGGSSGGTAAAIAAGVLPAAIGSDAGGSIRIPAAACGLIGLKPGRDTVPADRPPVGADVDPLGVPRMGVSGPMAQTAEDAAHWFDALVGDRRGGALAAVRRADEVRGLRIGVSFASPFDSWLPLEYAPESRGAVDEAITRLLARGHAVDEVAIRYDPRYPDAFTRVWTHALTRLGLDPEAEARLGDLARMFLERARAVPPGQLASAVAALAAFTESARAQWESYDAILTPGLAGPPPAVGAFRALGPEGDYRLQCEWAPHTSMVNVVGSPAIAVPVPSRLGSGLSVGVQLIGRPGDEHRLLQLAAQLTAA